MGWRERLGLSDTERAAPLEPGFYTYTAPASHPFHYRLHLRVEPNGEGLLVLNASTVMHLNQSATEYAYHFIHLTPPDEVAAKISQRYRVSKKQADTDYANFAQSLQTLIETPDLDPVTYLNLERQAPYTDSMTAPYRLDCALTYKLPAGAPRDAAPTKRVTRELSTEEWTQIIDKAYEVGIPHVLFTGGEPTLREDLPQLLQRAEEHGLVSGLITDGRKLGDTRYLKTLLDAGLDHAMIVLQPNKEETWDSLASFAYWRKVLDDDIFIAAHLTLTKQNAKQINSLIDRIAESGVRALSLSESDEALSDKLQTAADHANHMGLPLVWDMPVPYSGLNPVSLELKAQKTKALDGAGRAWLYVEPDGDVLAGQGGKKVLGNMLNDKWSKIWKVKA
ncbi:MAG: radical SAM protein [Anaerolineales bacterium]|nr:radical SAM protein [Anaerolineales bacterium]